MKRKDSFLDKLKVFIMWVRRQEGYGLRTSCDFCRSSKIERLNSHTEKLDQKVRYSATYQCHGCGAVAVANELWVKR